MNFLISSHAYAISAERKNKLNPKEQPWIVQVYLEASKIKMMLSSKSRVEWIWKNESQTGMDFGGNATFL